MSWSTWDFIQHYRDNETQRTAIEKAALDCCGHKDGNCLRTDTVCSTRQYCGLNQITVVISS